MDLSIEQGKEAFCFERIAKDIFNHYAIETHESLYRITEIEFYWNSENHKDNSTYKRNHVDPKNGEWFFHYSGVDIALKNEIGYGGILIRAIRDLNNEKLVFKGPMVTAMKIFSGTNAFTNSIKTKLVLHSFNEEEHKVTERKGLGKNAIENGAHKFLYRFLISL